MSPDDSKTRVVRGTVVLPQDHASGEIGDVIVQVEDVSRADAPSVVVGEYRRKGVNLDQGALPFDIEVPADTIDPRHSYSVRVHVDMTSSGLVEAGDYVSTESHPVLTRGHGTEREVRVRRV
jgi:uncharacterized lipoprotein YbaY